MGIVKFTILLAMMLFSVVLGEGITDFCPKCYVGSCDMQEIYSFQETLSESFLNVVLSSFCHYGVLNSIMLIGDLFPGTNPISFGHGAGDEYCIERIEYSIDGQMLLTTDCMFPLNEVLVSAGIARTSIELDPETTIHVESGVFDGKVVTPKYFNTRRSMPRIKRDFVGEKWTTNTRNVGKVVSTFTEYKNIKEEHPLSKLNNPNRRSGDEPDYVQEDHIFYPLIFILHDEGYASCNFKVENWVNTAIPVPLGFQIFAGEERMEVLVAILTPKFETTTIVSYENTRFVSNLIGYFRPEELTQLEAEEAFGWSHWDMLEDKFDIALYSMQYTFPHCYAMDGVFLGLGGFLTTMAGDGYIEWEFNGTIPYTCVDSININTQFSVICGDQNEIHGLGDDVELSAKAVSQNGARLFNLEVESAAIHKTTDNSELMTLKENGVVTDDGNDLGYDEGETESNGDLETELTKKITFILDGSRAELFAAASDSRDSLAVNLKLKVSYEDLRTGEIETDIVQVVKTLEKERRVEGGGEEGYCMFETDIIEPEYEYDDDDDDDGDDIKDSPAEKKEINNNIAMFLFL